MDRIGLRLRKVRRDRDLTLQALAERAGMTYQAINRIERGHVSPKLETVGKLADALGVDPRWLVFGDTPPRPGITD